MPQPINRIVIGDVGSGKTIVAFGVALTYLKGLQGSGEVAMLAPTEVLAYQHYQKLLELKNQQKDRLEFMSVIYQGGKKHEIDGEALTKAKFVKKLNEIKNTGQKLFWIGTHALLYSNEILPDLVMIDEQHRFGVRQRSKLSGTTLDYQPHFISFTATPIPRTLALTIYRSLKPHFLERLAGRNSIVTKIFEFKELTGRILQEIEIRIKNNQKVYVLCPKVEDLDEEDKDGLWSVQKTGKWLRTHFTNQVLEVHGKLSDKKNILVEFKTSNTKNILVATTVIEVGVDVADATLMIILNAERFGLAALHQIRGRVGRNSLDNNACFLVANEKAKFSKRLQYLVEYQDGNILAEKDLELRGSGNLLGVGQSGFDDEMQMMMGLSPSICNDIFELVKSVDLKNLENLPRLKKYLESEKSKVWEE